MFSDIRTNYQKYKLEEKSLKTNPIELFREWLEQAISENVAEPTVMVLSTIEQGFPDSRVVLLKELTDKGFVFYTNYQSKKGQQIENNSNVSLNFFWAKMERQVRVKGVVEKIDSKKSEEYFKTRPRESQLGACASNQSQGIENREKLEKQFEQFEQQFEGKEIQMPKQWGGYLVEPVEIEFWQGRPVRMHDRILFFQEEGKWKFKRLQP